MRWWVPLVLGCLTLGVPLGFVAWQVTAPPEARAATRQAERLAAAPTIPPIPTATPAPVVLHERSGDVKLSVGGTVVPPTSVPVWRTPVPTPPLLLPTPTPQPRLAWGGEKAFNFVAVGIDRRDREIPRTDVIMLGRFDTATRKVSLISIPRDLWVNIPEFGQDRINAAYAHGEARKEPGGGMGLLKRTIEKNFGVSVQHHAIVDFQCFRTAVDSVGGVEVDVPRAILDTRYPTEDYGYQTVKFDVGLQRMDGERALQYVRTRYSDSDFGRMRRQQLVVSALRRELFQLRTLPAIPSLLSGCRNLQSDLSFVDYFALANAARQVGEGDVVLRTVDEQMTTGANIGGGSVLMPRWELIRATMRDVFPGDATVAQAAARP
ncbi:MAG: LCP family protein [Chloroflexota bacterium]